MSFRGLVDIAKLRGALNQEIGLGYYSESCLWFQ
jgi:hypothetical protein